MHIGPQPAICNKTIIKFVSGTVIHGGCYSRQLKRGPHFVGADEKIETPPKNKDTMSNKKIRAFTTTKTSSKKARLRYRGKQENREPLHLKLL